MDHHLFLQPAACCSAYDGLHEYSDYIGPFGSGEVDLESLKYEDAIAEYNRTENK